MAYLLRSTGSCQREAWSEIQTSLMILDFQTADPVVSGNSAHLIPEPS